MKRKHRHTSSEQDKRQNRRQLLTTLALGSAGVCLATPSIALAQSRQPSPLSPIGIVPDQYTGTDIQKVQAAYDYALDNDLTTVHLNRIYDLTGGSIYLPSTDWAPALIFVGGGLTKRDDGFMFDRRASNLSIDAPKFQRVRFQGREGATAVISNGSRMIRQTFSDLCHFRHIAAIHADVYTQSVRLINTDMYESAGTFILAPRHYDLSCHENRFEANSHRLIEAVSDQPDQWPISVARFTNNCIQGYTRQAPIRLSGASSFLFQGNYCEHNNTTIEFVISKGMQQVSGKIEGNAFYETHGEADIDLGQLNCRYLEISNNTSNVPAGKFLIRQRGGASPTTANNYLYSGGNEE